MAHDGAFGAKEKFLDFLGQSHTGVNVCVCVCINLLSACYSPSVMDWIVSSPNSYVEVINSQYLRMWVYLKTGSLKSGDKVK